MHPKSPKLLDDTLRSCQHIETFIRGLTWDDYAKSTLVQDAVERNLTVIAESLLRLERMDGATVQQISNFRQFVGLRHQLAYRPDGKIDDSSIWNTAAHSIPILLRDVDALLESYGDPGLPTNKEQRQ